ncbi:hypothetical protein [Aeromonas jandaei]
MLRCFIIILTIISANVWASTNGRWVAKKGCDVVYESEVGNNGYVTQVRHDLERGIVLTVMPDHTTHGTTLKPGKDNIMIVNGKHIIFNSWYGHGALQFSVKNSMDNIMLATEFLTKEFVDFKTVSGESLIVPTKGFSEAMLCED